MYTEFNDNKLNYKNNLIHSNISGNGELIYVPEINNANNGNNSLNNTINDTLESILIFLTVPLIVFFSMLTITAIDSEQNIIDYATLFYEKIDYFDNETINEDYDNYPETENVISIEELPEGWEDVVQIGNSYFE